MRLLKTMLSLFALLLWSVTAKADDYNPVNPPEPGVNFTLTTRCVPQDGGYNLTQSGTYAFGSSIYLRVTPNTGYRFVGWKDEEGNLLSTSTFFSYTMPSKDITVTAHFIYDPSNPTEPSTPVFKDEAQISFAVNPADGGYFSSNYDGIYNVGTSYNFYVYPNTNYRFVNWTRDSEVIGTSTTLNYKVPNGDHTLVANFEYDPSSPAEPGEQHFYRRLTLLSNMPEAATLYGAGTYLDGTFQHISLSINQYYTFVNWTNEDGEVVSENSEFYLTMPNRHVTLTANFTYNYDPSSPGEPGTPNPDGSLAKNMVAWPRMGMYDDTHVMILCETPGSTIHYTLDGSDPTKASPIYNNPVYVGSNLLVKAIAYKEGMEDSPIVSYQVTAYHALVPVYTFENKMVKITSGTPDAIIRYTLDFTEPTAESDIYTTPFLPEENCRIKAYASKEGLTDSPVSIYVYRQAEHTLPAPTFSFNFEGKLVISPPVRGGVTRYTLDGTDPNESSLVYTGPMVITPNVTVKAYTSHINYFDSPIASYEVKTVEDQIPVIAFENKKIKITCLIENSVIRYTLDGSEPNTESMVYTGPFLPESDCTVKAYASKEGMTDTPVRSYEFSRAEHTLVAPSFALNGEGKLEITSPIEGGEIRYTLDGTVPNISSILYNGPITLTRNCTVKAYVTHAEYLDSPVSNYEVNTFASEAPAITFENKKIKITCSAEGAVIRYTLDGNEPNEESTVYTEPFLPIEDCTVKAYASKEGMYDSPVASYEFKRGEHTLAAPSFSLNGEEKLVITTPMEGDEIRYTMDGSMPNDTSAIYTGPITLTRNCTVRAYATHAEYLDSPVASYDVTTFVSEAPVISFVNKKIRITCATENAIIRYTLDGSEPNAESTVYTAPFLPESDCTVKAYASQEGMYDSPVTSYEYRRAEHTLPAPSFVLDNEKRLVIVPAVSDCMTRYTTDGSVPNLNSAIYYEPIELPDSGTVRAYSTLDNYFDSPVAEFIISEHRETSPTITPDFRNRLLSITQSESLRVALTIDGETQVVATPYTMEVTMLMSRLSAIALTDDADRLHSLPQTFTLQFHSTPLMESDGHTVYALIDEDDEPAPENAEVWLYFDEEERGIGSLFSRFEIPGFGFATAHVESDYAFRSDDALIVINAFNTGSKAGVMDDRRLSEVFGSWGDDIESYKYLEVVGDVAREDLQFLATLPELTTLHFDTNSFESGNYEGVLANSGIEAIFSRICPQGMLKGMDRLTTVMWGVTNTKMPEGRISEAGNPNILLWVADRDNAPSDARNVVVSNNPNSEVLSDPTATDITGEAEAITLRAGYPFNAYYSVEAKGVELIKKFDQPTVIGECQGWETIALPFTPEKILREDGKEIIPFSVWPGEDDAPRPFWLYTADGSDWQPASWIEAGQPYIISMPNNPEYIYDYNIMGEVGFMASNVKLGTDDSAPRTTKWKESMLFNATFMPIDYEDGMLSLNTQGEGNGVPGSIFTDEAETLPFGAYVSGAGSIKHVPVFGGSGIELPAVSTTGLTVDSPASGTIRISSLSDRSVTITAITGVTVAKVEVKAGESVCVDGLAKGIYIVAGIKIMLK